MNLDQYSYITNEDFNTIKDRIANEVLRRAKKTDFPSQGEINSLGNDYNRNPFTSESSIEEKNNYDIITKNYFNTILNFFEKFYYEKPNTYPPNTPTNYTDDIVNIGDIIYALNKLSDFLETIESKNRQNNNDCRDNNCMGLCTNACANKCTNICTGCENQCEGCGSGCASGCEGCSGDCMRNCVYGCFGNCGSGVCAGVCNGDCINFCYMNSD